MLYKHTCAMALSLAVTLASPLAMAIPIAPEITITGTTTLFLSDPDLASNNSYSADMYSVVGGTNNAGTVAGQALTQTGDGFGHSASLSGNSTSFTQLGGNYALSASNSSATDSFKLTFGISFSHGANADAGDLDARAVSELELEDDSLHEYLYSRLTSESGADYGATHPTWQDQIHDENGDSYLGTWGDALAFGETRYFDITLLAGDSLNLNGLFDLDGRIFDSGASYDLRSDMFIFLDDLENLTSPPNPVPEPASLLLLLAGLIALQLRRLC